MSTQIDLLPNTKTDTKLNKAQQEAVATIDGPVMIIAGPGTGKTTVLAHRVANILQQTDIKPESILAITYTEAGVLAMRNKLISLIGQTAYKVSIFTIHGFANQLIGLYPDHFTFLDQFLPLNDLERMQLMREILDKHKFEYIKPFNAPYFYIQELVQRISQLKKESIKPIQLNLLVKSEEKKLKKVTRYNAKTKKETLKYKQLVKDIGKLKDLLKFYRFYEKALQQKKRYDYEDMIFYVKQALKNDEDFKLTVQEKYQYFLIDEYQDTNNAQNELIFLLADHWGPQANIFVVGDDDQSIFRFQGASVENILSFKDRYPNAQIVVLKDNYRSQAQILDGAYSLIKNNEFTLEKVIKGLDKKLTTHTKHKPQSIRIRHFNTQLLEGFYLADRIKKLHKQKIKWSEMAILVRLHRDFDFITPILDKFKIPYQRSAGENVLANHYINQFINLLKVINQLEEQPDDDHLLFAVMNYTFLELPALAVLKLARLASYKKLNLWQIFFDKEIEADEIIEEIGQEEYNQMQAFFDKLNNFHQQQYNLTLAKLLEVIVNESNFLNHLLSLPDRYIQLNALNSLFSEIKALNYSNPLLSLSEFLNDLDLMLEYKISIKEKDIGAKSNGVQLLTAHGSKGLEFDYVFMAGVVDKVWGNKIKRELIKLPQGLITHQDLDQKEKNEDERRLFYVAMTRARKGLAITYSEKYSDSFGQEKSAVPSQFLTEIDSKYLNSKKPKKYNNLKDTELAQLLKYTHKSRYLDKSKIHLIKRDEKAFLNRILAKFKLSPTSLNSYLECPYQFLLNNILRTPRVIDKNLAYGSAIHKALENFFTQYKISGQLPNVPLLQQEFQKSITQQLLKQADLNSCLTKGTKALADFYQAKSSSFKKPIFVEYNTGYKNIMLRGARLTGKIDKIEPASQKGKYLELVDYKTGKRKTRNEILGKVQSAKDRYTTAEKYYHQLLFYKIMTDLDPWFSSQGYEVVNGTLEFVEPYNGKFYQETFEYKTSEIEGMKNLIVETWQKIKNFEFPQTKTLSACQYCSFNKHCYKGKKPPSFF